MEAAVPKCSFVVSGRAVYLRTSTERMRSRLSVPPLAKLRSPFAFTKKRSGKYLRTSPRSPRLVTTDLPGRIAPANVNLGLFAVRISSVERGLA